MPDKGLFDIHCHIVPSVDDGASSAEEAYKMLQMEYRQGVRNIIATPHYRLQIDVYKRQGNTIKCHSISPLIKFLS